MPTVEFAVFPLLPGTDPREPGSEAASIMRDTITTMHEQEGCQAIYSGVQLEDQSKVHLCVVWDSIDDHHAFQQSPDYGDFARKFLPWIAGPGVIHHADLVPAEMYAAALGAPVTEIMTFYFEDGPPEDFLPKVEESLENANNDSKSGFLGSAAGVTHENLERSGLEGKGVVLVIGWESEEHQKEYRKKKGIEDRLLDLVIDSAETSETRHVKLKKLT